MFCITRTPLRISFFGGGTDYPAWYEKHGGAVLSASIDKYSYITCRYLPQFFEHKYRIAYSVIEKRKRWEDIDHPSVRESIGFLGVTDGLEISYTSDVPAKSGLGSSSAFTVGLLHALYALQGKTVTKRQLALDAMYVEQKLIQEHVGSQDQVAAAFGGFNKIEFKAKNSFQVTPFPVARERLQSLQKHLMLFFTGISRNASDIACEQIKGIKRHTVNLHSLSELTAAAEKLLIVPRAPLDEFGRLLHESWQIKRAVTNKITTPFIDSIYEDARAAGALGGKLLGAGGGGFMLFFVQPEKQAKVRARLRKLLEVPFAFEHLGSQLIYYGPTTA